MPRNRGGITRIERGKSHVARLIRNDSGTGIYRKQ